MGPWEAEQSSRAQEGRLSPEWLQGAVAIPPPIRVSPPRKESCVHQAGGLPGVVSGGPGFKLDAERQRNQRSLLNIMHHRKSKESSRENIYFCTLGYTDL